MNELANQVLQSLDVEPELVKEILTIGRLKKVRASHLVVGSESAGKEIPIVLSGLLKVMRKDPDGREVFLYYLEEGETCAMSITCCVKKTKAEFSLVAEEDSAVWMVPIGFLDSWIAKFPSFRRLVFTSYQTRFDELLTTIDSIVFSKMDERLHKYLLDTQEATGSFVIHKTHEQIARDLDTSRVVISRLLKQMERDGKIEQYRNRIEIL
ncbi:MAG: Crp/Fnr family transcriptional regulator [Cyclobacteriaceae bacterium]